MGVTTSVLHYGIMKNFNDLFPSTGYYVFGSSLTDENVSTDSISSRKVFLEKTIFGKKLESSDVHPGIRRVVWEANKVYSQYDDTVDLTALDYYVVSEPDNELENHSVFKCISNNYGAVSTEKPVFVEDLASQNYILRTSDGYIWKYMYSVTNDVVQTHATPTLFPVITDSAVVADAKQGIDNIVVVNRFDNNGYESQTGKIHSLLVNGTLYLDTTDFNPTPGFYTGYTIYATSQDGVSSRIYTVISSDIRSSDQRPYVVVSGYTTGDIPNLATVVWTYSLLPRIEIVGDGTGALAIPVIEENRIVAVTILNSGQGYTRSVARVVRPIIGFDPEVPESGDVTCILRPIISPPSVIGGVAGHGGNPVAELRARWQIIHTSFGSSEENIPDTNTYSKVGLVRSPLFTESGITTFDNRIRVTVSSTSQLTVGDVVTQSSTNFRGIIHAIDAINSYIYITEFFGPYFDQSDSSNIYLSNLLELDDAQLLSTPAGRVQIVADSIVYPVYQQGTGEVLHIADFEPVDRATTQSEQFKFVITF